MRTPHRLAPVVLHAFQGALLGVLAVSLATAVFTASRHATEPDVSIGDLEALMEIDTLHLAVDLRDQAIRIAYGAALLVEIPLVDVQLERSRISLLHTRLGTPGPYGRWAGGSIRPVRREETIEIVSRNPDPGTRWEAVPWIPPAPDELNPVPARFIVRYPGGLDLEVSHPGASGGNLCVSERSLPRPWDVARVRLRLCLSTPDASMLFRAFPEGVLTLILPLDGAMDTTAAPSEAVTFPGGGSAGEQ